MLEHLQVAFFPYGINPLVTWTPNRTEQMLIRLCGGSVLEVLALEPLSFYLLDTEVVVVGRAVGTEPERVLG